MTRLGEPGPDASIRGGPAEHRDGPAALGEAGFKPDRLECTAEVSLDNVPPKGWTVTASHLRVSSLLALLSFVPFGLLLGLVAWFMIWMLGWLERQFAKISSIPYLRHSVGMVKLHR